MKKNFAVVYGSAVTKMFADGMNFPRDIDIMTNMDHVLVGTMALRWFERAYPEHPDPKKIPLDFHDPEIFSGSIKIPMIQDGWKTPKTPYHVLYADEGLKIEAYIRENGVASLLRLHGNTPIAFADKIRKSPEGMSIMPGDNYYSPDRPDMDKYYSGLQATRNAWAHVKLENRDAIIQCLNCGNLFTRLMEEDPKTWSISEYNMGWSRGMHIYVSSEKSHYVLWNSKEARGIGEEEAIQIIYG